MHPLTTILILSTALTLTTSTTPPPNTTAASPSPPPSASSLAALSLPGGTANPALTLATYADPDCTTVNASDTTLLNVLPLSYDRPSPQLPFWAFVMTRNLTGAERLTFYSSTNLSRDACGVPVGNLTAKDGGAGFCLPVGGATCYNLTRS
ncbi:hypothetical protein HO133_003820 [Letharia lupina]|uniref:Uncharacterized protein n=1 Tax=Letharia lupina TaxID=560253 RepID=A0A8H6F9C6_9LECA|nr:uncharacterized protein HO133_003820 [Letharia lupina]KAF6219995.1 hypothetical protein HO133_003820 [Letharia lupina]